MTPAALTLKAKNQDLWDAVWPFLTYTLRKVPFSQKEVIQCGIKLYMNAEDAELAYQTVSYYRLPVVIELAVDKYQ